ncbi:MAG: hypothetical protein KGO52_15155 [Nitrospirota bacterium]|nr:hypothetical protein [Nitrospirota bacterium]MDE3120025.1 hypothetical protein [Nitrospirota bacterium]MDE3225141.1 hypothetical protein [Nitrospirota bacterium]MDE3244047.1 hypothetical protein [Nitrospirota bacterium]
MRHRELSIKLLALTLAVGLLLLLGGTTGSAFAHDIQHAGHHSAGMHSQGICAWMCAAGSALDGLNAPLPIHAPHVVTSGLSAAPIPSADFRQTSASRAPPIFFR